MTIYSFQTAFGNHIFSLVLNMLLLSLFTNESCTYFIQRYALTPKHNVRATRKTNKFQIKLTHYASVAKDLM